MITNEIINRAIDYILQHINEELSIDDVAEYCHFSKFYFSRMFKAETGESIYAFIKRLRLEQSAFKLKVEPGRTITDIGCEYGYSSSNYSSAFRQRYRTTPADFRKHIYQHSIQHPFFHGTGCEMESFEECSRKIMRSACLFCNIREKNRQLSAPQRTMERLHRKIPGIYHR